MRAGPGDLEIVRLDAASFEAAIDTFAALLAEAVEGGASVGFYSPFSRADAATWWRSLVPGVADGSIVHLVAKRDGRIVGTVQLHLASKPNQAHRADVAKLLVAVEARGRGVAQALMRAIEDQARAHERWLLVLDTAQGSDAEFLYRKLGWTALGAIPDYAGNPDGSFCDALFFYKKLG